VIGWISKETASFERMWLSKLSVRLIGWIPTGFADFGRVLPSKLRVRPIGWISKGAAGLERVRFPEAPRPSTGTVFDGRMAATCARHICEHVNNPRTKVPHLSVR
jgi:hypothetical protein